VLLRQQVELLRCGQTSPVVAHLPFADHVHKLDTRMIRAQRKSLKPCIGRVMRLTARWSCPTMLLRYLHCRIATLVPCFAL
jgi:hypothetical protein